MMSVSSIAIAVAFVLIAVAVLVLWRRAGRWRPDDAKGLPPQLASAPIAYAETTFRSPQRKLIARLDRAYRVAGEIVLVELKTRTRDSVYQADVIELSVQRLVLHDAVGERVSETAWVVVEQADNGVRRAHPVRLLSSEAMDRLIGRYRQLTGGTAGDARPAESLAQCGKCGHRERCWATFAVRPQPTRSTRTGQSS